MSESIEPSPQSLTRHVNGMPGLDCEKDHSALGDTFSPKKACPIENEESYEGYDFENKPIGERWPPLGATTDEEDNQSVCSFTELGWSRAGTSNEDDHDHIRKLEEEQEHLTTSLLALTSHFAQVQFRLKQIVSASPREKQELLIELDEFANRGIPDVRLAARGSSANEDSKAFSNKMGSDTTLGNERQKELINQLKQQLEDLEEYAYQTGEAGLPQSVVLEKQKVIIDELKGKLNLKVDNFDKLSVDELKHQVDFAVKKLVNPLIMKEQLVSQLQTQIVDLERFIGFLQDTGPVDVPDSLLATNCKCAGTHTSGRNKRYGESKKSKALAGGTSKSEGYSDNGQSKFDAQFRKKQLKQETDHLVSRTETLLSMISFGCGVDKSFKRNTMKTTAGGYHWGDLRATLEIAIAGVVEMCNKATTSLHSNNKNEFSDLQGTSEDEVFSEDNFQPAISDEEIVRAVRKKLCSALRNLIQHGLDNMGSSKSLVPFLACISQRSRSTAKLLHAWDVILKYYHLKKGEQYNKTPARKLSESFNLQLGGNSAASNKEELLETVGSILSTHAPLKRTPDAHFKAFVCSSINRKKLVVFMRLIFRTQSLVEGLYQSWSYVSNTGFEDAYQSLDQLNRFDFSLPVDLAVRPYNNINDVF